MATYVLVHGAWHGSWEWEQLTPLLEAEGHRVIAVDLPRTTLEDNADAVRAAVESAGEPVILLGHSAGGMWITQAAEYVPDRIATLVYCAAFLPGAPVTPPPGWAPAPHKYKPRIGVRYCDHPGTGRIKNSCSRFKSP